MKEEEEESKIDERLISGIRKGDEAAFRQLFLSYYEALVKRSYQLLKDESRAKDAVQEVFAGLWKNRDKLPENIVALPYLKRGVINRSLNMIKSRDHHIGAGEKPLEFLYAREPSPDKAAELNELKKVVMTTIDNMSERCRVVFMMCRMEGLSHKEIAAKLDISPKTVESQMRKALILLRNNVLRYREGVFLIIGLCLLLM